MASKTFEAVKLQPTATVGIALLAVLVVRALMKFYYHRRMVAGLVSASQSRFHRKKSFADSSNLARTSSWIPPWAYPRNGQNWAAAPPTRTSPPNPLLSAKRIQLGPDRIRGVLAIRKSNA